MDPLQQFWNGLVSALGLPQQALSAIEVFAVFVILYVLYLILSASILYLSFRFLEVKVTWSQVISAIIIRDLVFLPLSFFAFGIGYFLAFIIWIGLLKYRFKLEWGRALMVALVAELLPAALTLIFLISFFATIVFIAALLS